MNQFLAEADSFTWLPTAVEHVANTMNQDGGHDWGHLTRVLRHAYDIANSEPVDRAIVTAAVLFHDVVNLPKDHPDRRSGSKLSADHAVEFCAFFTGDQRKILHDAIVSHSFSAGLEPNTTEGKVLRDADRLESLGALGIARTFYVCGLMRGALFSAEDPFANSRDLDDVSFALDHFFKKILKLEATILTNRGKELAADYTDFIKTFLNRLEFEIS